MFYPFIPLRNILTFYLFHDPDIAYLLPEPFHACSGIFREIIVHLFTVEAPNHAHSY